MNNLTERQRFNSIVLYKATSGYYEIGGKSTEWKGFNEDGEEVICFEMRGGARKFEALHKEANKLFTEDRIELSNR